MTHHAARFALIAILVGAANTLCAATAFAQSATANTAPAVVAMTTAHGLFGVAGVTVAAVLVALLATHSNNMRDASLPQMPVRERSFSLGRSQMAFWTFLIVLAFGYLFIHTGTSNVLSDQALMLMGISGATGLGAVAIDKSRDGAVKEAIDGLQQLGLNTAEDVAELNTQVANLRTQQAANPTTATALNLNAALTRQRQAKLLMQPYRTSGNILRDLVSENGGATVHRLQMVVWTLILGWTFMSGCFNADQMPALSNQLLAVMGISGGTYFGFKAAS
ncbi:MAG: hypothetical protein ACM31D_05020 [Bacteroidota bacterium]